MEKQKIIKPNQKVKAEKEELNIQKERQKKKISVLPRFQQQQGMISITTSQSYDDYFPQQSYSTQ